MFFKYFSKQIQFSRTFQDSPVYSSTFYTSSKSLCEPCPWLYFLKRKYSKTCLKRSLKRKSKIGFQDRLSLNAGKKYCRILPLAGKKYCRMLQQGAFCNTFDLHKAITGLRPLFSLFFSSCLRVLLQLALSAVCDCGIS